MTLAQRAMALGVAVGVLVVGPAIGLSGTTVDGAGIPSLTVVGDARYGVEPDAARVRVSVGLTIRNRRGETVTRRSWYDRAYLAIQPSASNLRVAGAGGSPSVRVSRTAADHKLVEIRFGKRVYSNQSIALRLSFDMRDQGGGPGRFVRIGPGLVSFPVWAFASDSTPGARATVVIPAGLEIQHGADAFTTRTARDDGTTELATAPLTDATRLRAYVVATGEAGFVDSSLTVPASGGSLRIDIRGWTDDDTWRRRMTALVERAATAIAAETGLAGPPAGLVVEEATTWGLGGASVAWDPTIGRLLVAHDAPDSAVVRAISDVFLSSDIIAERWAIEGLSEVYAERVAAATGVKIAGPPWSDDLIAEAGPLNAWAGPAAEPTKADQAALAASAELGRRLIARVGVDGARAAFARLASGESVYQPIGPGAEGLPPEKTAGLSDWRRILDAFEAEAESGATVDDLWVSFVVRPDEAILLPQRTAARDRYRSTVSSAAGWALPAAIREALANWRFDTAQGLLDEVDRAIGARAALEGSAAELRLQLPEHVKPLFERGRLEAALVEADAESRALDAIAAATSASSPIGPLAAVGLLGETPSADLGAARTAFESGYVDEAAGAASRAEATWLEAEAIGRSRLTMLGLLFGTLGAALLVLRLRRTKARPVSGPRTDRASQA